MDPLETLIHSSTCSLSKFIFPQVYGMDRLLRFSENGDLNTLGNNDGVENIGDAYVNMAILTVILNYLRSIQRERRYSDDKLYASAAFLHRRFISNNILARIHYKSGYNDPEKLCISSSDKRILQVWIAGNYESRNAPKVLADLFEANAWLITQVCGFDALDGHLKTLLFPLLPTALSMFEDAYSLREQQKRSTTPSDYFLCQVQQFRETAASKVDQRHMVYLMSELVGLVSGNKFKVAVDHLRSALEQGPPVRFNQLDRILGIHKRLQLLGHTTLRFYIAMDIDNSFPLNRSVKTGAARFQSVLGDLASSDPCLHYLVEKLNLDAAVIKNSGSWVLSSRSAAEIFVASVAMFKLSSPEDIFSSVMGRIVGKLVRVSYLALEKESGGKFMLVPSVPTDLNEINTFPLALNAPPVQELSTEKNTRCQAAPTLSSGHPSTSHADKKQKTNNDRLLERSLRFGGNAVSKEASSSSHSFTFTCPRNNSK
ncbi:hypothetical protein EYR40_010407 [Pleurotus pulmonarius]|nr:hypothetical protein EYR40_010407 [Pleurotus pulmonarius]